MLRLLDRSADFSDGDARTAAQALGVPALIAKLLYARGAADIAAMRAFLHPSPEDLHDPFLLPDMDRAVARLRLAMQRQEQVLVYGDYDVDGVCGTAMLLGFLQGRFGGLSYHVPSRHGEGYGMNAGAIRGIRERGVDLILTVDNGISAQDEIALCYRLGMEVIVTDHHRCGDTLPACEAVVCHTRKDSSYPAPGLCGAATAYKLIEALGGSDAARPYLPLAGLATVADVMPLIGENRALVKETLDMLNRGGGQPGLRALHRLVSPAGRALTARDFAFGFAPRLNAAGRLEHASRAVELLCAADEAEAERVAAELDALNARRQNEEAQMMREANAMLEGARLNRSIVLHKDDWNPGILGIAAARLTEKHHVPTVLLCGEGEELVGSGRSVEGVDLYRAILSQEPHLLRFGGHAGAAGLTIARGKLPEFRAGFDAYLEQTYPCELFLPSCVYEGKAGLGEINKTLAASLEALAPFGEGNPLPLFYTGGVNLLGVKRIGSGEHVRATASQGDASAETIGFYMGEELSRLDLSGACGIVYHPAIDVWRGESRLQLKLHAVQPEFPEPERWIAEHYEYKFYDAILDNLLYNYKDRQCDPAAEDRPLEDAIAAALDKDAFGALIVCCTPQGAERAMRAIRERALTGRVDLAYFTPDPAGRANTLLLAPKLRELNGAYRRIVAVDRDPFGIAVPALREIFPDADIAVTGAEGCGGAFEPLLRLDREVCKRHYRALRGKGRARYADRGAAAADLEKLTGDGRLLCLSTLRIFEELAFIGLDETGAYGLYENAKASDLSMSRTFQTIRALGAGSDIGEGFLWTSSR